MATTTLDKLEVYLKEHHAAYANSNLLLRDLAYKRLFDALRNVDFEPGEPLPEVRLSKVLGISRTPVREALQQLASEGLIQVIQGRAITVLAPSPHEVFDALYVRELLEPQCIRLCAGVLTPKALERVTALTKVMEGAAQRDERAEWSRADREWHEVLSLACPNKLLGQMVLAARNRMYHRGSDERVPKHYLIEGTAEHRAIVDALQAQDGVLAESLMRVHLQHVRENILNRFSGN